MRPVELGGGRVAKLYSTLEWSLAIVLAGVSSPLMADEPASKAKAPTITANSADRSKDAATIHAQAAAYAEAFGKQDAKAIAAQWTENGELEVVFAPVIVGRDAIEKEYAKFFREHPKAKLQINVDSLRFVGQDLALENGRSTVTFADGSTTSSRHSVVHVRENGKWLVASSREWSLGPDTSITLDDLAWLIGQWSTSSGDQQAKINYEWHASKKYIVGRFEQSQKGGEPNTGLEIIAIDPTTGRPRSWMFGNAGGFSESAWRKEKNTWVLETAGVFADGTRTVGTIVITPSGDKAFSWQTVNREADGVALPNTRPIKVTKSN